MGCAEVRPIVLLSTIVLNWNRADLLARTLDSYAATVSVPHEVIIIDNGSADESGAVIERFQASFPAQAILLPENRGGAALNLGIERARGELIHLSENDLLYEPGWSETVVSLFDAFPNLGQLSLFGPTPRDDEIWELKPSVLRHARGRILYEDLGGNLGTASILRRELFDRGLRVTTFGHEGGFLFPNDMQLSADVKAAGYMIAWAPHYLVRNVGHSPEEFNLRSEYYTQNYRAKPWLGEDGWRGRISSWQARPVPSRDTVLRELFSGERISPEKSVPNGECPEPQLWSMFDGWTAEVEIIELIYGLVRATKPCLAVETGTWHGMTAAAIGRALQVNGRGRLVTTEIDPESFAAASARIEGAGLVGTVATTNQASLSFKPDQPIDFLLLDSELGLRLEEFRHFQHYLAPGAIVVFHDTNASHAVVRAGVEELSRTGVLRVLTLRTPRGIAVCQYATVEETANAERQRFAERSAEQDLLARHTAELAARARTICDLTAERTRLISELESRATRLDQAPVKSVRDWWRRLVRR